MPLSVAIPASSAAITTRAAAQPATHRLKEFNFLLHIFHRLASFPRLGHALGSPSEVYASASTHGGSLVFHDDTVVD